MILGHSSEKIKVRCPGFQDMWTQWPESATLARSTRSNVNFQHSLHLLQWSESTNVLNCPRFLECIPLTNKLNFYA